MDISKSCGKIVQVASALSVTSPEHVYKVLPNCLKCLLAFAAEDGYQLSATFHTFGTEAGPQGQCSMNRVDLYTGETMDKNQLLSSKYT